MNNYSAPRQYKFALLFTCMSVLLLSGCSPAQMTQTDGAQNLSAQGDHVSASRMYLDLAVAAKGEQRQRYLIFAADELFLANDLDGSETILKQIGSNIAATNIEVWAEATAQVNLARNNPEAALTALNKVTGTDNRGSAARILLLRSEALFQLEKPKAATASLLQREELLQQPNDIKNNRRLIWSGLQTSGRAINRATIDSSADPVLNGWLELGEIAYLNRGSLGNLSAQLREWQAAYPQHPASQTLLNEVLENLSALSNYPPRVALLLPLSGRLGSLGESIRDGYIAAHFALGESMERPEIMVYDTARNGATAAYQQALLNGTDFIVGPLLKDELQDIAELSEDVTVLALNYAPEGLRTPANFYQFALAPEDEAKAAANRAADEGMLNAVALVPDTDWGKRVLAAFSEQLDKRGGTVLAARTYLPGTADFSKDIRAVLLLNESYARRNRLAANIGKSLEFEPRRRQDVDLVFIGANAAAAKLIKPQLRFHYAGDLPTYATSAIYQPDAASSRDLDGIMFPDMPWLLKPNLSIQEDQATLDQFWGENSSRYARYYAMGYDAYHLTAVLYGRSARSSIGIQGMTGMVYLERDGQLHRELPWARMERGKPRVLPELASGLTQDAQIIVTPQ